MQNIPLIFEIAFLFILRIGAIEIANAGEEVRLVYRDDRWQTRREAAIRQRYETTSNADTI